VRDTDLVQRKRFRVFAPVKVLPILDGVVGAKFLEWVGFVVRQGRCNDGCTCGFGMRDDMESAS
jgi:hypothetical protein